MNLNKILNTTCQVFDCTPQQVKSKSKGNGLPKNAYYLIAREYKFTHQAIAEHINRTYASCISANKTAKNWEESNPTYANQLEVIRCELKNIPLSKWAKEMIVAEQEAKRFFKARMPKSPVPHQLKHAFEQGYLLRAKQSL